MRSVKEIERLGRKLVTDVEPAVRESVLADAKTALVKAVKYRGKTTNNTFIMEVVAMIMRNGYVQVAAAAVIAAAIGLVVLTAVNQTGEPVKEISGTEPCSIPAAKTPEQIKAAELAAIDKLYALKNTKGLALALSSTTPEVRLAAANFLALIGDANCIEPLEKAGAEWQGEAAENPFIKAAETIKQRVGAAEAPKASLEIKTVAPPAPTREGKAIPDGQEKVITVKVLEAGTGRSLAGAKVQGRDSKGTTKAETDAAGMAQVKVWRDPEYVSVVVTCPGHVGQMATWRDETAGQVPGQQAFRLDKGTIVGGVVKNTEGEPIEAVAVEVYRYYTSAMPKEDGSPSVYVRNELKTGKDGRWQSDVVPADMNNIGISFEHPEYQAARWSDNNRPEAELRAMSAVMAMQHGMRLYGVVRDATGQPVKGARIQLGEYGEDAARTGDDGRFDIRNIRSDTTQIVTVQTKPYAPVLRLVEVSELAKEQVFVLEKGQELKGKVVDANGVPVPEAAIYVEEWQDYQSLRKNMKSLKDGTFGWKNAPAGAMKLSIQAGGYMEKVASDVVADGQERVYVLSEPVRVKGKVTDAMTGESIEQFEMQPGIAWADQDRIISFQPGWTKQSTGGQYDYTFDRFGNCYAVRIIAKGYLPAESRIIEPNERLAICDIVLQRSAGARGVVRQPDGTPAAGVAVYIFSKDVHPFIENGKLQARSDRPQAKTDAEGRFSLAEPGTEYKVGVIGDAGLAMVTSEELKHSDEITLAAWGRVEGQYFTGSKPAAGRKLQMVYQGEDWSGSPDTMTDKEGRFALAMVRPGESTIDGYSVEVVSGQTTTVVIGGTGRTVKAELVLSEDLAAAVSKQYFSLSVTRRVDEETMLDRIPVPSNIDSMTLAEVAKWLQDFGNSDEGRKLFAEFNEQAAPGRRYMPVKVEGDTITIEDVPAGQYVLKGTMYPVRVDGRTDYENPAASVHYEFEVPKIEEGQIDVPLDLGRIEVGRKPAIGTAAPNFELEGADGRKMQLSDYAGKVVLVVLCVSQEGPEDPEITGLKKLYETYSGESRFAMIGIVPGPKSNPIMRVMMREMALPWPVGHTSMQKASMIMRDYGAGNMSMWNVLVGADGKIIAASLKGEELHKKVEEALAASR